VTPFWRFLARRTFSAATVLLVVVVMVFSLLRLTLDDPAAIIAGDSATAEQIQQVREGLGLDRPVVVQFGLWFGALLQGDLGQSFFYKKTVVQLIAQRLEPTLALAFCTIVIAVVVAVPVGALAGWYRGGWLDRALMSFSTLGFSIPVFVLGYLLIWVVSLKLRWLPVQGYDRLADGFIPFLRRLILPSLTLSLVYIALIARVTRAAVSDALAEDFVRTARAKGLPEWRILVHHALATAAVPIVTVIGIGLALLLSGVVVTERVFSIPGLGQLTVEAVLNRDFRLVQAVILLFSGTYVLINFLIDLSYLVLDPRIRY
jgi:peptide/nickel transport system permease protein